MKTKKLTTILVLIMILAIAVGTYNISLSKFRLSDSNYSYLAGLTWHRSSPGLERGFEQASLENKPIAIYLWASWCQYCAEFQTNTLANPQIKKMLEDDFVLVALDRDIDSDVSYRYEMRDPPQVLFLDSKGNVMDRIYGKVGPEIFLPIATQVRDRVRSQ